MKHEGRVSQLQASTVYDVEVDVRGQRLCLTVDGIELIAQHLPHPLEGERVGSLVLAQFEGSAPHDCSIAVGRMLADSQP